LGKRQKKKGSESTIPIHGKKRKGRKEGKGGKKRPKCMSPKGARIAEKSWGPKKRDRCRR